MLTRTCSRLLARSHKTAAALSTSFSVAERRFFSSKPASLLKCLAAEVNHEKASYEKPPVVKKFLEQSGWTLEEKDGDVNMSLTRKAGDRKVTVDFQLTSPVANEDDNEEMAQELTDFSITIETPEGAGVTLYCSTTSGQEDHRYLIGNVRVFTSASEKENPAGYNGPEFEDLDEGMQEGIDEWLSSLGVSEELCDFIDAAAIDKEQREYMRWLSVFQKVVQ